MCVSIDTGIKKFDDILEQPFFIFFPPSFSSFGFFVPYMFCLYSLRLTFSYGRMEPESDKFEGFGRNSSESSRK